MNRPTSYSNHLFQHVPNLRSWSNDLPESPVVSWRKMFRSPHLGEVLTAQPRGCAKGLRQRRWQQLTSMASVGSKAAMWMDWDAHRPATVQNLEAAYQNDSKWLMESIHRIVHLSLLGNVTYETPIRYPRQLRSDIWRFRLLPAPGLQWHPDPGVPEHLCLSDGSFWRQRGVPNKQHHSKQDIICSISMYSNVVIVM